MESHWCSAQLVLEVYISSSQSESGQNVPLATFQWGLEDFYLSLV
jgi:hypothetical protein